jgi:AcrR family transcriptional regulator
MKVQPVSARARKPPAKPALVADAPLAIPSAMLEKLSPVVMQTYASGDFHRADMRTIARESSTSFRSIYRYFGDKQALLFRFINYWFQGLYPAAFAPLDGDEPIAERLRHVLMRHCEFYERNPQVGRIVFITVPLSCWMQDDSYAQPEMMDKLLRAIKQGQTQGALRSDVPAIAILDAFNGIFNRAFLMWEYRGRKDSLSSQADLMFKVLWGGIQGDAKPKARRAKP